MAADLASTTVAGATFATGATSALAVAARATTTFILPPARGEGVALRLWAGLSSRAAGLRSSTAHFCRLCRPTTSDVCGSLERLTGVPLLYRCPGELYFAYSWSAVAPVRDRAAAQPLFDPQLMPVLGHFEGDSSRDFAAAGGQRRSEGVQMLDSRSARWLQPLKDQKSRKLVLSGGSSGVFSS